MSGSDRHVVVVGGGVIGASCAHFLLEKGFKVTILERDRYGAACSKGNCGLICPSHVLPLAEPGAITRTLGAMLSRNSPFSIKPRLDWRLWSWMLQFARRCNQQDMLEAGRAIHALLDYSYSIYESLLQSKEADCEWEKQGLLFVYRDERSWAEYETTNQLLEKEFNHGARRVDGAELVRLEPAIKTGLAGAWYYEGDAHLRPERFMAFLRSRIEQQGGQIRESSPLDRIVIEAGKVIAAETNGESIPCSALLIATGARTPLLESQIGCRVPIEPGKGYSITMKRPAPCPAIPMIFPETRVAVTPMQSGYRLGSTMEFAGYDESISEKRLNLLREGARPYLVAPEGEPVEDTWYGWRPMTYDSLPVIDRSPKAENLFLATGHNMLGLSMAPGTGRLVSQLVAEEKTDLDLSPYRVSRFH